MCVTQPQAGQGHHGPFEGGLWLVGRIAYAVGYARDPARRAAGFTLGALAFGALGLAAGGGVVWRLIGGGA